MAGNHAHLVVLSHPPRSKLAGNINHTRIRDNKDLPYANWRR